MKILVVDDDAMVLESIAHTLGNEGYDVVIANDGFKALEIIENHRMDLIISDIMMPHLSGITLLGLLKQFYSKQIPVILISSLDKGEIIVSALGLGANDFMVKPINYEELTIRVKKFI